MEYYSSDINAVIKELKSDSTTGLTEQEALLRLQQHGKNKVQQVNQLEK
ncbi:MAG: cation-transporting P-type ATPase [Bacteroidetes bacterium]|nr:cation-transporting P-type ATPase [Bacteroidota bacterium]